MTGASTQEPAGARRQAPGPAAIAWIADRGWLGSAPGDAAERAAGKAPLGRARQLAADALEPPEADGAGGAPTNIGGQAAAPPAGGAAGASGAARPAGRWGATAELALPLDDRGLLLADGLFETVLVEEGQPRLLEPHLERWHRSAALLGMAPPPGAAALQPLLAEAVARSGIRTGALRLNWSRGGGGRGLNPPAPGGERFWLQLSACTPAFTAVAVIVSPTERRCASSLLSRCKTFAYGSAIQAHRQAHAAGADDALLESSAGGLCSGTAANLLLRQGGRWLTPALSSGCLPGVMRRRGLELGLLEEASEPVSATALLDGRVRQACLLNSLGCRPLRRCAQVALDPPSAAEAEAFWRSLLG